MNDQNHKTRLQDDPEVLAYQFINVVETANGTIKFGGNAFIREDTTWNQIYEGMAARTVTQFINCKVIVWRKARTEAPADAEGFKRF